MGEEKNHAALVHRTPAPRLRTELHKIMRFFAGAATKGGLPLAGGMVPTTVNGLPGFLLHLSDGIATVALEIDGDRVVAFYLVRNPDQLRHLES
jgi:hypothetical protein